MAKKVYSVKNSKGEIRYLHGKGNFFYLSKRIDSKSSLAELPNELKIMENKKTGFMYVAKK